ncbi:hypothetical protein EMGBS15_04580 [Filimonas sp.]|jgi:hypothetical protein|nr:hypothetical protein EMGBS15_04580 [Filimonas sp.]
MRNGIRYTLIADGSSDKALMNIIKWLLDDLYPRIAFEGQFADFRHMPSPPEAGDVQAKIITAEEWYPFDILFYHRDAETSRNNIVAERTQEIREQMDEKYHPCTICLVPVRMMESWLLFDADAIKKAAGNRRYNGQLDLPALNRLESIPSPKQRLHDILKQASELKGRKLAKFNVHEAVHLVAENIQDFAPLRNLPAFQQFEAELRRLLQPFINALN